MARKAYGYKTAFIKNKEEEKREHKRSEFLRISFLLANTLTQCYGLRKSSFFFLLYQAIVSARRVGNYEHTIRALGNRTL